MASSICDLRSARRLSGGESAGREATRLFVVMRSVQCAGRRQRTQLRSTAKGARHHHRRSELMRCGGEKPAARSPQAPAPAHFFYVNLDQR